MAKQYFRFAFAITEGPNAGLRCGGWRLKVTGEDVYVFTENLGDKLKVSLHSDAAWRLAHTKEWEADPENDWPDGHTNPMWEFSPTGWHDGQRSVLVIGASRGSLRPEPIDPREHVVASLDRWDEASCVVIAMTEPGQAIVDSRPVIAGPFLLDSGRQVWALEHRERYEDAPPPSDPHGGVLVRVYTPEEHHIPAPLLLSVGFNQVDAEA